MYHLPALLWETLDCLNVEADGVFVDATFGGGGHSKQILQQLGADGRLVGFDQDEDALANVPDDSRFTFVNHNFRYLSRFLRLHTIDKVDGVLADLGVSSHQLDKAERGFSYRFEAELDMRMNQQAALKASEVLNTYTQDDLQRIFSQFGEVRNARSLAVRLVEQRSVRPFIYTQDLLDAIAPLIRGNRLRYLSQVFQALRIEVNAEMEVLEDFLNEAYNSLKVGGRLVIISYHSIEDRMVKHFFKTGNIRGEAEKDFYGNIHRPFKILTKKAILPSPEECKENPRARSAKLRAAIKIGSRTNPV